MVGLHRKSPSWASSQFSSFFSSLQPIKYIVKKKKKKRVPSTDGLRKNERKKKAQKGIIPNGLKKMDESPKDVFLKVQRLRVFL